MDRDIKDWNSRWSTATPPALGKKWWTLVHWQKKL